MDGIDDAPAPLGLADMMGAVSALPGRPAVTVDISRQLGAAPGTASVTLTELDARRLFSVPADAKTVRRRCPDWPPELCQSVALLALAHAAPPPPAGTTPGDFYVALAKNNAALFTHLLAEYRRAFPSEAEIGGEASDDTKND